jgi:hypothetical protein
MPYYFDLKFDGEDPTGDEEGMDLEDAEAAQVEAVRTLCDFSGEVIRSRKQLSTLAVIVRDEGGPVLSAEINLKNLRPN